MCALIGTSREKCFRVRSLDISHNEGALRSPRRARRLLASLSRALQASRFLRELNAAGCTAGDPDLWILPLRALHGVLSHQLHTLSFHGAGSLLFFSFLSCPLAALGCPFQ